MKKILLILAMTLTIMSCSKESTVDFDPNEYDLFSISGAWANDFTGPSFILQYGIDFGNGTGNTADGYIAQINASCFEVDGPWDIISRTATSLTISGDESNLVTLTKYSSTKLKLTGTIYGIAIGDAYLHAAQLTLCN